jgi:hypothetical protein
MINLAGINFLLRRRDAFKKTFGSKTGELVLADILKFCGNDKQVFVPNDPNTTAFNAGKHRVAQHILAILNMQDDKIKELCNLLDKAKGQ